MRRTHLGQYIIFAILIALFANPYPAEAARRRMVKNACKVTGIVPLREYLLPKERQCFRNAPAAQSKGYTFFEANTPPALRARATCNFVGIRGSGIFYSRRQMRCFRSVKAAKARGYTHFEFLKATPTPISDPGGQMPYDIPPTPIPTVTPTPTPTPPIAPDSTPIPEQTATPTPTAVNAAINYPNIVLWRNQVVNGVNEGYQVGTCSATLSGDRTILTLGCEYDYPNITELHLHLPPDNTEYCPAPNPTSPVAPYQCRLTPEVAAGIEAGKVFIMIHSGPPGEGEMITAAGYF